MSAPAQKPLPAPVSTMPDDVRVALGPPDGVADLVGHRLRPRVERFRAVQRDDGDRVVDLEEDLLVGHASIMAPRG